MVPLSIRRFDQFKGLLMGPGTAVDYDRSLGTRYAVISEILAEPLVNSKGLRWAATLVIVQHCVPGMRQEFLDRPGNRLFVSFRL